MVLHLIFAAMLVAAMLAILVPLASGAGAKASAGASRSICTACGSPRSSATASAGFSTRASAEAARNEAARMLLRATEREMPSRPATRRKAAASP